MATFEDALLDAAYVREVAMAICRVVTNYDCVMDENPERPPCTAENCRMVPIAIRALAEARSQ